MLKIIGIIYLLILNVTEISMFFQHVYDKTLSQGSYVIGCQATGEALVIDAKRDVDTYQKIAKQNGLKITHVTETHIHADFLTGTRELAALTNAQVLLSDEGGPDWQYEFPHEGLRDGSVFKVGNLSFEVMHTPGHTPESISFLLRDHPATDEPVMLFTGDFVFVGDVGRPDLLEEAAGLAGTKEICARDMHQALSKFAALPGYLQVWPGHGAGSACGKALGAVPSSTVGYELIHNWAFKYGEDSDAFVHALLEGQPEPPTYFAKMKELNKVDRELVLEVPQLKRLSAAEFLALHSRDGVQVIDARDKPTAEKGTVPGAFIIPANNTFATWAGWLVDYEDEIVVIAKPEQVEDVVRQLMRIGMDKVVGYLDASDVTSLGVTLEAAQVIDIDTFKGYLQKDDAQVVDVRNLSEYHNGHIDGVEHIFLGTLERNLGKFDKSKQIVIHCQSGIRAAIANSILSANGFKDVKVYSGGMNEWKAKEEPVVSKPTQN